MISPAFPFQVATEHLRGYHSGDLIRYGTILKDANTGRIVAHLQETGALQQAFSNTTSLLSGGLGPVSTATSAVSIVQNQQIKTRLDEIQSMLGGIQSLQLATLATSFVGIGVTVASTAMILSRLQTLGTDISRLEDKIDALPTAWRDMRIRETIVDVGTSLERLDESGVRTDATQMLQSVEEKLDRSFNMFADSLRQVTIEKALDADLLRALFAGLALCGGAQIKALVQLDEKEAAQSRAAKHTRKLEDLTWNMPEDVLSRKLPGHRPTAHALAQDISELRLRFASREPLIANLIAQKIPGPLFLERAAAELEEPLLLLPEADWKK